MKESILWGCHRIHMFLEFPSEPAEKKGGEYFGKSYHSYQDKRYRVHSLGFYGVALFLLIADPGINRGYNYMD